MTALCMPPAIEQALARGFDLAISISGGKDSDCMARLLVRLHREHNYKGRVVLIHAHLGRAEHAVTLPYIERLAAELAAPLEVIDGGDLVDMMWARLHRLQSQGRNVPHFPSAKNRYCTSDAKRNPISKWLRGWVGKYGKVICAQGLRAEESPARAKKPIFQPRVSVHTKTRMAYDWNPIHNFTLADVWQTLGYTLDDLADIRNRSEDMTPQEVMTTNFNAHPAYALGNDRLSCALCILASQNDLRNGAKHHPDLYREYVQMEVESGFSFQQGKWLGDLAPELLVKA